MKKLYIVTLLVVLGFKNSNAQDEDFFAVTAGYINASSKERVFNRPDNTINNSGFYAGIIGERYITYEFWLQGELLYVDVNEVSFLQLPVMAKFYVSDNFNLLAGPQLSYTLEKAVPDYTNFAVGLTLGVGYNITRNLNAFTRYTFQINDYYTGTGDSSLKSKFFNIGLAYKLSTFK